MRIHHTIPAPPDRPPYHEWAKLLNVGRRHDKANRTYIDWEHIQKEHKNGK